MLRRMGTAGAAALVLWSVVTLIAAESGEVIVIRTLGSDGVPSETRIWIVEEAGAIWVEAATPERDFLRDIIQNDQIEIVRGGQVRAYTALVSSEPGSHDFIRGLMKEKYGLADWWIGLFFETARSVAIRLEPRRPAG